MIGLEEKILQYFSHEFISSTCIPNPFVVYHLLSYSTLALKCRSNNGSFLRCDSIPFSSDWIYFRWCWSVGPECSRCVLIFHSLLNSNISISASHQRHNITVWIVHLQCTLSKLHKIYVFFSMFQGYFNLTVFQGLSSVLHTMDEGLICSSNSDLETMTEVPDRKSVV